MFFLESLFLCKKIVGIEKVPALNLVALLS